ncbi:hypothetical protein PISMIDRAFT_501030 [Pisolithus microcarpus 441]|uniref:Uncharacterized protein n=1 Tax=Pisolithus microcarpus 441 TaxID=765257 RepID=A0A0C9ZRR7_9AGAM|nr:hypothetical protein BKA83DRAFT_501030 [Pisolithus microcarpus]KIK22443.1 hypothetical protein PISMIDRAFT_501030 [Pisolithus microcarpus 441]
MVIVSNNIVGSLSTPSVWRPSHRNANEYRTTASPLPFSAVPSSSTMSCPAPVNDTPACRPHVGSAFCPTTTHGTVRSRTDCVHTGLMLCLTYMFTLTFNPYLVVYFSLGNSYVLLIRPLHASRAS